MKKILGIIIPIFVLGFLIHLYAVSGFSQSKSSYSSCLEECVTRGKNFEVCTDYIFTAHKHYDKYLSSNQEHYHTKYKERMVEACPSYCRSECARK